MSKELSLASLKELFRFPFRTPDWQSRFLVGAALYFAAFLLYFLPCVQVLAVVPALLVAGYIYRIMRQTAKGEELVLPLWDDWGRLAIDGLKGTLISLVYTLPGLVCMFGGMFLYYFVAMGMMIPLGLTEDGGQMAALFVLFMFGSMAILFLSMFLGWALMLLGMVPLPMATVHFATKNELAAAFRLREIWSLLKANKLGYFVAWVVIFGLFAVQYFVFILAYTSIVLCVFIPILIAPIMFYVQLVFAATFGVAYRESVALLEGSEGKAD